MPKMNIELTCLKVQSIPCWPVANYWHLETRPRGCFNLFAWIISTSCIETSTDFVVALVPVPLVYIVRIGTCERMVLLALFITSVIPACFALTRTIQLIQWGMDESPLIESDFSW
ncbi:hypothetical protein BKA81DRAFT_404321 [Phyllosticta paracitricarpa]|uniref:Rhodopsin domain-containing protein n=2 Tax=Phyllosticta TaxID=121621 RepID=A0ABR1MFG5_9PEZI